MFEGFFDANNRVFRYFNRIFDMIVLNVLFVITCIPVITIGPALTALYYVSVNTWARGDGYIFQMYLKSFKENFKQAIILWIGMAAAGAVVIFNFSFWLNNAFAVMGKGMGSVAIAFSAILLFLYAVIFTYVWVLLAKFENTVWHTVKNALFIGIGNLPLTICIWLILALVGFLMYRYSAAMACGVLFGFAVVAYLQALIMRKVLKPYLGESERLTPEEELEQEEQQKQERIAAAMEMAQEKIDAKQEDGEQQDNAAPEEKPEE